VLGVPFRISMSVRTEPRTVDGVTCTGDTASLDVDAAQGNFGEGQNYCVAAPDNPLRRNLVVSIRASLNALCLQKSKGVWSPSTSSLQSMLQQRRFTKLDGTADCQGDLKSVVLHDLAIDHIVSTFPIALGTKITGVDDRTFSSTGEPYSLIVLPNSNVATSRSLQADDVALAYDFAKKWPGYTAENLATNGIHEVAQRRFVLVAIDHPIVSAIQENASALQMGEISMMPEGLVKISQGLFESILPAVKTQVQSQIKVRDFTNASVSIQPADYSSWDSARAELMLEKKRPHKAKLEAALAAALNEDERETLRAAYTSTERELENAIDNTPFDLHLSLGVSYNFLSK